MMKQPEKNRPFLTKQKLFIIKSRKHSEAAYGEYGFEAFQLDADDDSWKEKVIERAEEVKRKRGV